MDGLTIHNARTARAIVANKRFIVPSISPLESKFRFQLNFCAKPEARSFASTSSAFGCGSFSMLTSGAGSARWADKLSHSSIGLPIMCTYDFWRYGDLYWVPPLDGDAQYCLLRQSMSRLKSLARAKRRSE